MNMRCSLLGHSEGEEEVETIREETDEGVIEIEQTYRECTKCGNKRVITENKSVRGEANTADTSMDTETEASFSAPSPDAPLASDIKPSEDGEYRDAIIIDNPEPSTSDVEASPVSGDTEPSSASDGVIVENADEQPVEDSEPEEPSAPVSDITPEDATVVANDSGAVAWKDAKKEAPVEDEVSEVPERPKRRILKGGKQVQCPACGYTENQHVANLVAGDACPACRRAYLGWYEPSEDEAAEDAKPDLPKSTQEVQSEASQSQPSDSAMFID
jgi:ssDNA-binding Zn-finger/Zn-ribbon topoisomerase 1